MGVVFATMQRTSLDVVQNALAILNFISLCALIYFFLLRAHFIAPSQTGAPYINSGKIAPSYIVLRTLCLRPHVSLADLERAYISVVHFVAAYVICSLNLNLLSKIIPKYFILFNCFNCLKFKNMLICFLSFLFLLDTSMAVDLSSLNSTLWFFAHARYL